MRRMRGKLRRRRAGTGRLPRMQERKKAERQGRQDAEDARRTVGTDDIGGEEEMCWEESVDMTIEALAKQIKQSVDSGALMTEETWALAELISARAQVSTPIERRNQ